MSTKTAPANLTQRQILTQERHFRVMGSSGQIIATGEPQTLADDELAVAIDNAVTYAAHLESLWSRFLPTSEISRLNQSAGRPCQVSSETMLLIERACQAWRHTGGWFNPLQLNVLINLGYDRDFGDIRDFGVISDFGDISDSGDISDFQSPAMNQALAPRCDDIRFDHEAMTVTLPSTGGFDPGGIGKGLAADLIAESLIAAGAAGALVNLGGDLRSIGTSPSPEGWNIHIADDIAGGHNLHLRLASGAVATSTSKRRQWNGKNHLVDPETERSSDNDLKLVSVIAGEAWQAELLATAIAVAGGPSRLPASALGGAAVLITNDVRTITHGSLKEYLSC